jgi:23S rRNA pseudouridine2605 synthase
VIKQRLSKVMAAGGIASRRKCEEFIFRGEVTVNGQVVLIPQTMVDENDSIMFNGQVLSRDVQKLYFILNKPAGYLCTSLKTGTNTKIVLDLFNEDVKERLFTVGRLDQFTTGLLIVTNDGHFANQVIHPSANILKEYLVKTDIEITPDHLKAISNGTLVEGVFVKPHRVTKVRRGTLKVVVAEGKKREVRLLLAAAGLNAKELSRIRIGALQLGSLPLGGWRPLTEREKQLIFEK